MAHWTVQPSTRIHRFVAVQRITGILLMLFSFTMLPPIVIDQLYEASTTGPFFMGLWITFLTGAVIWWPARKERAELKTRDGFLITVLFWAVLGLFGAIPLIFTHAAWNTYTDAIFESVSGLTTTGATTVASGLDDLPHALNFYRAQLHWLGGMGIIVLAVAVLPMLGVGGMQLYRAETPGPMKNSKLTPRITETARVLWFVYAGLTTVCGLTYWALGMDPFDALCHAFSTMSTGGFSTRDASIGYWNDPALEAAVIFFMFIAAVNFALHFLAMRRIAPLTYWRDAEFRAYFLVLLGLAVLVCVPLYLEGIYDHPLAALRYGLFTLVAYATDSGFAITDPTPWPSYVPAMIVLAGLVVGCSGSTAGGVKMIRLLLFVKQALREMQKLLHPSAELPIKLNGKVVPNDIVYAVGGFFSVYVGLVIVLTFVMMATGLEPLVAFSAVAAALGNLGPGLGEVASNVSTVSTTGKWVMIFAMLLGRLEVFTLLIVLTPSFWKR
ncbi:MAG: potassium transporter TrkG [Panacagrimonas sp.]